MDDFVCALQKKILLQGRLYVFEHYVCFYANVFGYVKKIIIPLKVRAARHTPQPRALIGTKPYATWWCSSTCRTNCWKVFSVEGNCRDLSQGSWQRHGGR